jgi:tetratricopeptide (TPR) repeat protein
MKKIRSILFFITFFFSIYGQTPSDTLIEKYNKARLKILRGNYPVALKIAQELIQYDSVNCKYLVLLSSAQLNNKMYEKALHTYQKAFSLCHDTLKYYIGLDLVYDGLNQVDSAEFYISKAIDIKKDSAFLYVIRAFYRLQKGNATGRKEDLKKAAELGDKFAEKTLQDLEEKEKQKK